MKPINNRLSVVSAGLAAGVLMIVTMLTGCGTGQHSQSADQRPAVNGAETNVEQLALRDIYLQAVQTDDHLEPGRTVKLILAVANESRESSDRLVSISTDIGDVTLSPTKPEIPVGGRLLVGTPVGQTSSPKQEDVNTAEATVELSKPITNGIGYDFTFEFDKSGTVTVAVPISAGLEPQPVPAD